MGYGGANFFENSPTPTLTNSTAAIRLNGGCTDTDINNADFATGGAPTPRNTASPLSPCGGPVNAPVVPSCPANLPMNWGTGGSASLSAADADGVVISAGITSAPVAGISVSVVTASPFTATLNVRAPTVPIGTYPVTVEFCEQRCRPAEGELHGQRASRGVADFIASISAIQGPGHLSPLNGQNVSNVAGIVTVVRNNGFYIQSEVPDADTDTSDGLFVFTNSAPAVVAGQLVAGELNGFGVPSGRKRDGLEPDHHRDRQSFGRDRQ